LNIFLSKYSFPFFSLIFINKIYIIFVKYQKLEKTENELTETE